MRQDELENMMREYQQRQEELQALMLQKHQLEKQVTEIEMALKTLDKVSGDAPLYKSLGGVFIAVSKEEAEKELKEKKELFEVRIRALAGQEDRIKQKVEKLEEELQEAMRGMEGS